MTEQEREKEFEQFLRNKTDEWDRLRLILEFHSELSLKENMLPTFTLTQKPTLANKRMPRVRNPFKGPPPKSVF